METDQPATCIWNRHSKINWRLENWKSSRARNIYLKCNRVHNFVSRLVSKKKKKRFAGPPFALGALQYPNSIDSFAIGWRFIIGAAMKRIVVECVSPVSISADALLYFPPKSLTSSSQRRLDLEKPSSGRFFFKSIWAEWDPRLQSSYTFTAMWK